MVNFKITNTQHVKEGLIVKHGEVDISRIRTAIKIMQSTWTLVSNHKGEHAVGPKWALVTNE